MIKVLITGANGFVGKALCEALLAQDFNIIGAVRTGASVCFSENIAKVVIGKIDSKTDWQKALRDIDVVVHLAARVHVMEETALDPLAAFREVNTRGTENLARQAAANGVKRFIYLSSIKVNGEESPHAFSAYDQTNPKDPYAISKWEAERALKEISTETGLEIVIIRPPLVYGPGVKGNFLRLLQLVNKGIPIPLGKVTNKRSMVSVDNLCDLIKICIDHPKAKGEIFLVSDNRDTSTPELIRIMANALQRPARLVPVPPAWLYGLGKLIGKKPEIERLCSSLPVDIQKTIDTLGWSPPYSVDTGVKKTATWFKAQKH